MIENPYKIQAEANRNANKPPQPGQPPQPGYRPMPGQPPVPGRPMPGQPGVYRRFGNNVKPGRGGLILTLALLGGISCGITQIFALVMGHKDLEEIKTGRMDYEAKGMTLAGVIISWVSVAAIVLELIYVVFMLLVLAA